MSVSRTLEAQLCPLPITQRQCPNLLLHIQLGN
jgi:hypothetical protein